MAYEDVKEYLLKIPANPLSTIPDGDLEKAFFKADEDLRAYYHPRHITPRVIIYQAIYNSETTYAEYRAMKAQGISSISTKRGSVSFEAGEHTSGVISPQVIEILGDPPAMLGRFS